MTSQARKILRLMKSVVSNENQLIFVNYDTLCFELVAGKGETSTSKSFSNYSSQINSTLDYLVNEEYIYCDRKYEHYQILHKGFQYNSILRNKIKLFCIKSILVPIVVSLATTLLINLLLLIQQD